MVNFSCDNSNIFEWAIVQNNVMIHKQIEKRDGLTFFRVKKRKIEQIFIFLFEERRLCNSINLKDLLIKLKQPKQIYTTSNNS